MCEGEYPGVCESGWKLQEFRERMTVDGEAEVSPLARERLGSKGGSPQEELISGNRLFQTQAGERKTRTTNPQDNSDVNQHNKARNGSQESSEHLRRYLL